MVNRKEHYYLRGYFGKNRLVYLPIYMLMFLQHDKNDDLTYRFDLTGLK